MLDQLKAFPDHIRFYNVDSVPTFKDSFLLSNENINLISRQWLEFMSPRCNYDKWRHPNELMQYIPCHISFIGENHLNITLLLERFNRFHTFTKHLPKAKFVEAFKIFSSEKRPYIIVDAKLFSKIKNSIYSIYALIDFVGTSHLISEKGEIPTQIVRNLKKTVDKFSIKNPNYIFLTCADNIIVKSSYSTKKSGEKYQHENFIVMINRLMKEIKSKTSLDSYTILTQGVNYVDEKKIKPTYTPGNHFFMSSISMPFIEAFEIDTNVRSQIRNGKLKKSKLYLEKSFYYSLDRNFLSKKEPDFYSEVLFFSDKLNSDIKYIPLSFEQLQTLTQIK